MIEKNFKTLGFKDMHPMQREVLLEYIVMSLNIASNVDDDEILEEMTTFSDELVRLFGGQGVTMTVDVDL